MSLWMKIGYLWLFHTQITSQSPLHLDVCLGIVCPAGILKYNGGGFVTGTICDREGFQWGFRQTTAKRTSIIEERNEKARALKAETGVNGKHKSDTQI